MHYLLLIIAAIGLPDAGEIPGISGEAMVEGAVTQGNCWLRVLETDYAVLKISTDTSVPMTAYDDTGEPLAVSTDGSPLVLSAYSDYWFWIKADTPEVVQFTVEYVEPEMISGNSVTSDLSSAEMTEIWTFVPDRDGKWNFLLLGNDEVSAQDLELYGPGHDLWAGSYSLNSSEKFSMNLMAGEQVEVIVTRFNKGGSGEYSLDIARAGEFPILSDVISGDAYSGNIQRYLLPDLQSDAYLELTYDQEADLDLYVRDRDGDILSSSTTYYFSEGVLIQGDGSPAVVEVYPYDVGEEITSLPFSLTINTGDASISSGETIEIETGFGRSSVVEFTAPTSGFYTISVEFDKLRDGDLRLFDRYGEPSVFLATERGDEGFVFWIDRDETVQIIPGFLNSNIGGMCKVSVRPSETEPITGLRHGRIDERSTPQHFYTVRGEAGTTLVIELRGDQRNLDLDMLVSGADYVLQAEGGVSNTDNAADESVTLYCGEDALFGVTVYAYERDGEGTFTIEAERIPAERLAQGSPDQETWAVVTGISGYQSRADILSRASMDAIDMYRFLRDEQNLDPDHMILLVDAEATAGMFSNAMEDIARRAGEEDRLIVYYSGHGSQEAPGYAGEEEEDGVNEVLCFYDEDLSDDRLKELTDQFPGAVYLFADACHSGGLVNDYSHGDNVLVVTAAREDLSVSERILTPILLEASRGAADSDRNGSITAQELVDYVDDMLSRICPVCDAVVDSGMAQCPECTTVLKGEYRIPRPEQGLFIDADHQVWN